MPFCEIIYICKILADHLFILIICCQLINMNINLIIIIFINWQPYLKGLIQEICEYDWFKLLATRIYTERYQYRIRNNHNGSKVTCNHEFRCNAVH